MGTYPKVKKRASGVRKVSIFDFFRLFRMTKKNKTAFKQVYKKKPKMKAIVIENIFLKM